MGDRARIAVFVSGGGTNLQALIDAQRSGTIRSGAIVLVISSNENAYALKRAATAGIPAEAVPKKQCADQREFEDRIKKILREHDIDFIILAGFLSILSAEFISEYENKIINVHPSLIPSFCGEGYYGLRVHEEVLKYGCKVTGATVHFVNEIPDGGKIIYQKAVDVMEGDTPEELQQRVMREAEWVLLPRAAEYVSKEILKARGSISVMDNYNVNDLGSLLAGNTYPGRGIVLGTSADGKYAVSAYFIMGRSENSRNRVFRANGDEITIYPFDESKVSDPSLIIYSPVRVYKNSLIVTNGNQTDTIYDALSLGGTFESGLETRCFEPDQPNWTPRISGIITFDHGSFSYKMSILKSIDEEGSGCARYTFEYPSKAGLGHFIHTYNCDGSPIPTFTGEPERVEILDDIDEFTDMIWENLNEQNKISLYVRYTDIETGRHTSRIINKNK